MYSLKSVISYNIKLVWEKTIKYHLFDDNKQTYLFLHVVSLWPERESLETIQTNDSERVVFLFNQHCHEKKWTPLSYYACLILVFILKFNYTYDIPVEVTVE